jgi:lipoprotein-anchoring transpeptidase ErfK/SrfK
LIFSRPQENLWGARKRPADSRGLGQAGIAIEGGGSMKLGALIFVALIAVLIAPSAEAASVIARVDKSSQTMTVYHHGKLIGHWPVSTARAGKVTPSGTWTAKSMKRYHRSSRYNNAPMPYSIFYSGHFAIHGTNQVKKLGRPASAGCIRLHPANAAELFNLVKSEGLGNMQVVVVE